MMLILVLLSALRLGLAIQVCLVLCSNFTMQLKDALQLKLKQMIKLGATLLLL